MRNAKFITVADATSFFYHWRTHPNVLEEAWARAINGVADHLSISLPAMRSSRLGFNDWSTLYDEHSKEELSVNDGLMEFSTLKQKNTVAKKCGRRVSYKGS
ncbi:hypothetical protein FQN51_005308 [Onygenales sp. PD_10]|nr:hypothetical protein FQN51_005308 [Onygenales sp. PD_10]